MMPWPSGSVHSHVQALTLSHGLSSRITRCVYVEAQGAKIIKTEASLEPELVWDLFGQSSAK